jgi:raffinose synthase
VTLVFFFCNSGDPAVESFEGTHLVYVGAGSDPFEVITNAVKYVNVFCI